MAYETRNPRGITRRYGLVFASVALWLAAAGAASCGGEDFVANTDLPDGAAGTGGASGSGGKAGSGGSSGSSGSSGSMAGSAGDASVEAAGGGGGSKPDGGKDAEAEAGCTKDEKVCNAKCVALTDPKTGCGKVSCDECVYAHASAKCDTGSCALDTCDQGFDNCDKDAANGCEGNLLNDPKNCGTCANECKASGGTPICENGVCGISTCDNGKGDCDNDKSNGCETDILKSTTHCGFCNNGCSLPYSTPKCDVGTCKIDTCDSGRGNCDALDSTGCEIDTDTDISNCGKCGNLCPAPANSNATCVVGVCKFNCTGSFADCDTNAGNGCEVDQTIDVNHCGGCNTVCSTPNGVPKCEASLCQVASCNSGFDNCDGQAANGCEADLTSLQHCGSCANSCPLPANATASCTGSTCGFTCNQGFADCDGIAANGCEVNLNTDVLHCGTCPTICALPNASQACVGGSCQIAGCTVGWGDCNSSPVDGCEVDITTSVQHCGNCATACSLPHANPVCSSGACVVGSCQGAWANCDAQNANGCETDLNTSMASCGGCGATCDLPHTAETCSGGVCQVTVCEAPYLNCDNQNPNGCEANSNNDAAHCGNCSTACNFNHATGVCISGSCGIGTCDPGWGNCDAVMGNGCETNTNTSMSHCGQCFSPCSFQNAAATCSGGTCTMGACNAGFSNCDGDTTNGCEVQLSTSGTNCGACGHNCLGGTCTGGKCDPIMIASAQNKPWAIATDGAYVYWDNRVNPGGSINRVPVIGGTTTTLAANQAEPEGLAINGTSVFWVNFVDGKIQSVPLSGGVASLLATTAGGAGPAGIAVAGPNVYFANWNANTVQRVSTGGGALFTVSTNVGNLNPNRVASDGTFVWWANWGTSNVRRANIDATNPITGPAAAAAWGVAVDATYVYWTEQGGNAVKRALLNYGSPGTIASGQDAPAGIAVDATHVYWVNGGASGTIQRVLKVGGTVETLASLQQGPVMLALDAVSVYWANNTGGTIMRVAK